MRASGDVRLAPPFGAAALAFAIAVAIEFGQYFHILNMIGLDGNRIARTLLGSGFDPRDFLVYAGGAIAMLAIEAAGTQPRA